MPEDIWTLCLTTLPPALPGTLWSRWSLAPELLLPLLLLGGALTIGIRRGGAERWHVYALSAGWALLALALLSPLCRLAATLVSAHMVQVMVLAILAPVLLVAGRVVPVLRAALGRSSVEQAHRCPTAPALLPATLVYGLVIWLLHAPPVYAATLTDAAAHLASVLALTIASIAFWSAVATMAREAGGRALMAVLTTMAHTGFLGALLTFSPRLLYPLQAGGAAPWGLTPLEDQQLAGLLMWVPGSALYLAAGIGIALRWLTLAAQQGRTSR